MAQHDNIFVTGPYIAYQSVGTQFIGGTHTHNYPAPETTHSTDHRLIEDITPSEDSSFASDNLSDSSSSSLFCRITKAAYDKGVAQQVDDDLRSASVSAPKLVKALNTNDALGYTDTKNLPSTDLYDMLNEHYHLSFKSHAFSVARSK